MSPFLVPPAVASSLRPAFVSACSHDIPRFDYSVMEAIQSPYRTTNVLGACMPACARSFSTHTLISCVLGRFVPRLADSWTPREIALFEAGMLNLTKDFHVIQKIVRTKTTNQCVEFYYEWKKSAHYQMWKASPG